MNLQEYRPKMRTFWAAYWDCTAATQEDVRRLVGLAGCRVDFEPCGGGLVATVRQAKGKRCFSDPCMLVDFGDGYVRSRLPGAFELEYEAVPVGGPVPSYIGPPLTELLADGTRRRVRLPFPPPSLFADPDEKPTVPREIP